MKSCGMSVIKYILFAFNFIFAVSWFCHFLFCYFCQKLFAYRIPHSKSIFMFVFVWRWKEVERESEKKITGN